MLRSPNINDRLRRPPAPLGPGLCLRLDIDTFSTRHDYTRRVGWGCYPHLPRLLAIARDYGATLQFCTCGQGLSEYPDAHRAIRDAGHPIDSHLHTHEVTLLDPLDRIANELEQAEAAFANHHIPWTGIGATGMYPEGIDHRPDVHALLVERGYRWCSSRYNLAQDLTLPQMQPYWLTDDLLEIPCAGMSDQHYFQLSDDPPVEGYIDHCLALLEQAAAEGLIYAICVHPGRLARNDPDSTWLRAMLTRAAELAVPTLTMRDVREREAQAR